MQQDKENDSGEWSHPWPKEPSAAYVAYAKALNAFRKQRVASTHKPLQNVITRSDDVFVDTQPKAGTTWMCQIVQMLRSGCKMDYERLEGTVPFVDFANEDVFGEQPYPWRAFKTHAPYHIVPKGAKYIVVTRHPLDIFVSAYKFTSWVVEQDVMMDEVVYRRFLSNTVDSKVRHGECPDISMEDLETAHDYLFWGPVWAVHLLSWWPHRNSPNVLWLTFEDMKEHHQEAVRKVAEFLGIDAEKNSETVSKAVEMSTLRFMKEHGDKINEPGIVGRKVNEGKVGSGKESFSPSLISVYEEYWKNNIEPLTKCASYEELRNSLNKEQGLFAQEN